MACFIILNSSFSLDPRRSAVRSIAWLDLRGIRFSLRMVLKDTSGSSKQEACDDDRQQASGRRAHDKPSVKLEADNKNKHHNNGDSALSKDTEGQSAKKKADDKGHNDDGEP